MLNSTDSRASVTMRKSEWEQPMARNRAIPLDYTRANSIEWKLSENTNIITSTSRALILAWP